jgi:hypothetical protein
VVLENSVIGDAIFAQWLKQPDFEGLESLRRSAALRQNRITVKPKAV